MGQIVSFTGYTPPARFDDTPWTEAQIQEAATSEGSWTVIDTVSIGAADPDPSHPQSRSFTTDDGTAPDLWYRVVFLDGSGGESIPTDPVQNGDPSPTTAFATSSDFGTRLGLTMTVDEQARADQLLATASDVIRDEVKRGQLNRATSTITMRGTSDESIFLPDTPVISVSQVLLAGEPLTEGHDWYLDGNMIVRLPVTRAVILDGIADEMASFPLGTAGFGWPEQILEITYDHGYDPIPGKVKAVCLEMVTRVWVNPGSVARETVGDTFTVYDNNRFAPVGLQLTDDERHALKRLFGATAKSVTIGR